MRLFALALFLGSTLLAGCATGPAYNSTGQTSAARPTPAAAPPAIPAAGNTSPAAGAVELRSPLKRGDELAYRLTDRMTRVSREVVYRVDRIEGNRVVFNQGGRVESLDGAVITLDTPIGGDLERMAPPQGWIKPNLMPGERWPLRYSLKDGGRAMGDYRLTAEVKSKTRLATPVGELDVFHVEYTGWVRRTDTSNAGVSYKLVARAWYAPELGRIVRFESDNTPGTTGGFLAPSRETIELIAIRRL